MKLLIVSDLHGSVTYLEKLIEVIKEEQIDKIIFLGDYFSYSKEINNNLINLLNSLKDKIIAIKGNCDNEKLSNFLKFKLHNYYLLEIDNLNLFITHGNIDYSNFIDDNMIQVSGHTHKYSLDKTYINPGSITCPRGSNEHTYIIYENQKFSLYDINEKTKIKELTRKR